MVTFAIVVRFGAIVDIIGGDSTRSFEMRREGFEELRECREPLPSLETEEPLEVGCTRRRCRLKLENHVGNMWSKGVNKKLLTRLRIMLDILGVVDGKSPEACDAHDAWREWCKICAPDAVGRCAHVSRVQ